MLKDTTRRCSHIGADGAQCMAAPMRRKQYCFFHDPAMKTKRLAASRDGGLRRGQKGLASLRMPDDMFTKPLEFHTNADLAELARLMLVRLCRNEINPLLATIAEQLVRTMMRARENAERGQEWAPAPAPIEDDAAENPLLEHVLSRMTEVASS
jgi:hypothetical protein